MQFAFISLKRSQCSYHGVLAHQNDTLTAHGLADLVHLLRGDIVDRDDEDRLVLLQQPFQFVKVSCLVPCLAPHSVCAL